MTVFKSLNPFFILMLIFYGISHGQQPAETKFQVVDYQFNNPVIYATVVLMNAKIGVISDDNGNFRIPSMYKLKNDTLKISCIGYKTIYVPLETQKESLINKIYLEIKVESLDEVEVVSRRKGKKLTAEGIVKMAIERIPQNYPRRPYSYIAYYRDYQQILNESYLSQNDINDENAYINLNEGIIQVFDSGFGTDRLTNSLNQTVLYEFKGNRDFHVDTVLTVPYDNRKQKYLDGVVISPLGGNELNLLNLTNAIRNYDRMSFSFAHVFNKDFVPNHIFTLDKILYFDDSPLYRIDFKSDSRNVSRGYRAMGSITISKEDFGIYELDYKLFDLAKSELLYSVHIAYKIIENLYYLNYITFNNHFEVKAGQYFKVDRVEYAYDNSSFLIYFNESVDPDTIKKIKKQFVFIYNDEPLQVINASLIKPDIMQVRIASSAQIDKAIYDDKIRYEIKQLRDITGRMINKQELIRADQFREIFVQKILPGSKLDTSYNFVQKNLPLKLSRKNSYKGKDTYWINTPLKASK